MVSKQDGQVPLQTDTGWKKRSISLASSVGLDHCNWALVFESRGDSQACLMLKMGGVVALPIFTLLALTGYGLYDAIQTRMLSEDAVISIQSYFKVSAASSVARMHLTIIIVFTCVSSVMKIQR